jgi:hypothetical protein
MTDDARPDGEEILGPSQVWPLKPKHTGSLAGDQVQWTPQKALQAYGPQSTGLHLFRELGSGFAS